MPAACAFGSVTVTVEAAAIGHAIDHRHAQRVGRCRVRVDVHAHPVVGAVEVEGRVEVHLERARVAIQRSKSRGALERVVARAALIVPTGDAPALGRSVGAGIRLQPQAEAVRDAARGGDRRRKREELARRQIDVRDLVARASDQELSQRHPLVRRIERLVARDDEVQAGVTADRGGHANRHRANCACLLRLPDARHPAVGRHPARRGDERHEAGAGVVVAPHHEREVGRERVRVRQVGRSKRAVTDRHQASRVAAGRLFLVQRRAIVTPDAGHVVVIRRVGRHVPIDGRVIRREVVMAERDAVLRSEVRLDLLALRIGQRPVVEDRLRHFAMERIVGRRADRFGAAGIREAHGVGRGRRSGRPVEPHAPVVRRSMHAVHVVDPGVDRGTR